MAIWRRFEFWVVTGFVILGAIYVIVTQTLSERLKAPAEVVQVVLDPVAATPAGSESTDTVAAPLPFSVESIAWREQGAQHWLLEMKVKYRNDAATPEILTSPKAGVVTGSGEAVEPFFLAAAPVPQVAAEEEETVELRYWVGEEQARGELWLEVDGLRTRIEAPPARM